jgi:cytoskeletal protein RodZ
MSQSIGQKLAAARKRRDLTVEDVAHETRIHVATLRHLEADDYSHFANYTYARSFLSMYGQHLGIEMTDYLKEFRSTHNGGDEHEESHEATSNGNAPSSDVLSNIEGLQSFRTIAALAVLFGILCTIPGMYFLGRMHGFRSANQIAGEKARAAATVQLPNEIPPPLDLPSPRPPAPPVIPESPAPTAPVSPPAKPPQSLADLRSPIETPPATPAVPADPSAPVEIRRPAVVIEEAAPLAPPAPSNPPEVRAAKPLE